MSGHYTAEDRGDWVAALVFWGAAIGLGLAFVAMLVMAASGCAHRDMKPENVAEVQYRAEARSDACGWPYP